MLDPKNFFGEKLFLEKKVFENFVSKKIFFSTMARQKIQALNQRCLKIPVPNRRRLNVHAKSHRPIF